MRPMAPLLVALAFLAGCTGPATNEPPAPLPADSTDLTAGGAPLNEALPQARAADPHGEVERAEGPVEVRMEQGRWYASQTVTLSNGVGSFLLANARFETGGGPLEVRGADVGSYRVVATVEASGLTEQMARDELARHRVAHEDAAEGERLAIATTLESDPATPIPGVPDLGVPISRARLSLAVQLPDHVRYDLVASSSSGSVALSGLRGGSILASSSSGAVQVDDVAACVLEASASSGQVSLAGVSACRIQAVVSSGSLMVVGRAAQLEASASSGSVQVTGAFDDAELDASSGSVTAHLTPMANGTYRLSTSSGSIDLGLETRDGRAFDASATASSGSVSIFLPDAEVLEDEPRSKRVRTNGYASAPIQTRIEASAASGSVSIAG